VKERVSKRAGNQLLCGRTANNKEEFFRSQNPFFTTARANGVACAANRALTNCSVWKSRLRRSRSTAKVPFSTLDNPSSVKIEFDAAAAIKMNSRANYPTRIFRVRHKEYHPSATGRLFQSSNIPLNALFFGDFDQAVIDRIFVEVRKISK
jgi:hypothetical protein